MAEAERPAPIDEWPRYHGWLRTRGRRWQIAAQGQSEREASDKLDRVIQERGPGHYDLVVLREGTTPWLASKRHGPGPASF